jgi:hypothetical protein
MWESLLALLAGLAALLLWWLRRRADKQDSPHEQNRERYEAIDDEMAHARPGRPGALRGGLADDLDELDRLSKSQGDRGGPGGPAR